MVAIKNKKSYRKNKTRKNKRRKTQKGGNYSLGAGPIGNDAVSGKVDLRVPLDNCNAPHPHPLQNMNGGSRGYGIVEPKGPLDQTIVSASGYPIIEPNTTGCFAEQTAAGKKKRKYGKKMRKNKTRKNKMRKNKTRSRK